MYPTSTNLVKFSLSLIIVLTAPPISSSSFRQLATLLHASTAPHGSSGEQHSTSKSFRLFVSASSYSLAVVPNFYLAPISCRLWSLVDAFSRRVTRQNWPKNGGLRVGLIVQSTILNEGISVPIECRKFRFRWTECCASNVLFYDKSYATWLSLINSLNFDFLLTEMK